MSILLGREAARAWRNEPVVLGTADDGVGRTVFDKIAEEALDSARMDAQRSSDRLRHLGREEAPAPLPQDAVKKAARRRRPYAIERQARLTGETATSEASPART